MQIYERLEEQLCAWADVPNMVVTSNGTTALHLALESLQLPLGSKVIVPEFTMVACARAVTLAGLTPVFVDCGEDLLLDMRKLEESLVLHSDVRVIMAVHIYGRRCDMLHINTLAKRHKTLVVEDMAELHGVSPCKTTTAACWSFYQNKIVAGEEGGAISFQDKALARYARALRCQGFTEAHDFIHLPRGMNARLSNANARLILESLYRFDNNIARRRKYEKQYDVLVPKEYRMPSRLSPWVYDVSMPFTGIDRLVQKLKNLGIQARHSFKPMSMQPEYQGKDYTKLVAYRRSREVFYLPFSSESVRKCANADIFNQHARNADASLRM